MSERSWRHAAAGGLVGAMAMSGLRTLTEGLGLLSEPPPVQVARHGAPGLLSRIPARRRRAAIELAHWGYGAAGALPFAALPRAVRRGRFAGPLYGVATWAPFEAVVVPALGVPRTDEPRIGERMALIADHALYGAVVASADARA